MNDADQARQCVRMLAEHRQDPPTAEQIATAADVLVDLWVALDRYGVDAKQYGRTVIAPRAALDLVLVADRAAAKDEKRTANRAGHAATVAGRGW